MRECIQILGKDQKNAIQNQGKDNLATEYSENKHKILDKNKSLPITDH